MKEHFPNARALYHELLLAGPLTNSVIGRELRSEFDEEITNANAKHQRSGEFELRFFSL